MSLHDDGKVYLEVGVNEVVSKDDNPNVPYTAGEVAADIVACVKAGATAVHFHARNADGSQAWVEDAISREVLSVAAREVDVLAYPSYHRNMDHVWSLADNPPEGTKPLLAPFDPVQHVKRAEWHEDELRFGVVTLGADDPNRDNPPYPAELDVFRAKQLVPNVAVFSTVDLRWTILAARAGLLRQPVNIKLFFSDRWVSNFEPHPDLIDFVLSRIPDDIDHETVVVPYAVDSPERCDALWDRALERGLGIRVGIGDCPRAFPTSTNRELVALAVEKIRFRGLEPASQDDLRRRCGVPVGVV